MWSGSKEAVLPKNQKLGLPFVQSQCDWVVSPYHGTGKRWKLLPDGKNLNAQGDSLGGVPSLGDEEKGA